MPPLGPLFSILCSVQENLAKIVGWCPHLWGWRPPRLEHPKSAIELYNSEIGSFACV